MTASHRLYRRFATVNCWLGAAATGLIMMFYGYEVVARYLFNAPTLWTVTTSGYLMLASVFLALPLITLERLHVESTFLIESAPRRSRPGLRLLALLISAGYCLLAAWMTAIVA
ncbi:MAG: TRAP transporter small permease, partial [Burkholderiaceae bacterium]